jgi:hypothetical protein
MSTPESYLPPTAIYLLVKIDKAQLAPELAIDGAAQRCRLRLGAHVVDAQPIVCGLGQGGRFDPDCVNLDPAQTRVYGREGIPMATYAILRASLRPLS